MTVREGADQRERISRRQVHKFTERRDQLARSALKTLAELGYARTSLREIAQNSPFSHGVLHYYFTDKTDLITHCVRLYNDECVTRYDDIVAGAATAADLRGGFCGKLVETMVADAEMHRLWYDLRNQALFEPAFRSDVVDIDLSLQRMIWRVVSRYGELRGDTPVVEEEAAYAVFDGLFQQALTRHLFGDADAGPRLAAQAARALDSLFGPAPIAAEGRSRPSRR